MMNNFTIKNRVYSLLIITTLLCSCTTKFAYNYLDWILEWYVDDLVTLNEDQEWKLRSAVESVLEWHRMNQIPFYIKTLEESETAIHEKITLEFLKRLYFAHEKGWMDLKYRVTPSLTGLLKTLDATQINELQENLELQEKEMAEKYINKPPDQLINERVERMIDRLEYWIGDLTKEQQQIVVNWSHQVKLVSSQWAVTREEWQYNFIDIVRKSRGKPEFNSLMLDHFQNSRKYWPKGYKESYYHNIDRTLEMFVQIGAILSQQQKQDLLENINDLKKQMQDIYKKT